MNKYIVAVAPNEDFIGPLQRESLECSWKYVKSFSGDLAGFLEGLKPTQRNNWMRNRTHASKDSFPQISNLEYTISPYDAMEFDSGAEAHLFGMYIKSFFPDGYLPNVVAEKREDIALRDAS